MSRADGATLPLPLDTDDPVRALGRRIRTLRVAAFPHPGRPRPARTSQPRHHRPSRVRHRTLRRPRMGTVTALALVSGVAPEQLLPDPCRLWVEGGRDRHD